jgi:hypothetical protein
MKKYVVSCTIFLIALTACWGSAPTLNETIVPVTSNGYTGLQDETFEFNLTPTNSRKPTSRFAVKNQTSNFQAQADYIDIPTLKARVLAVKKSRIVGIGSVATSTEFSAVFTWSSDTPLTGSVTLYGFHAPEYAGASAISSAAKTGLISTTKTAQRATGFTGNTFRYKIPDTYECVFASWNLSSGPFQYQQIQPVKLCKQPVKTDFHLTLTGPRAPKVGFITEYRATSAQLIQSATGLNPNVRFFLPDHAVFQNIDRVSGGNANSFDIQCNPESITARVIRCTGSSAGFATYTLRVKHTSNNAETFRVEVSSDTPERNPADNTASLTVIPVIENTTTDLSVTGNTLTSSSIFVEDQLEQIITVKNLGPGVAANAFVLAYQSGQAFGSLYPRLPAVPSGCVFEGSFQIKCPLPVLSVGEEFTLNVPLRAQAITTTGNRLSAYVQYEFDTNYSNSFVDNPNPVIISRDPLKEHALEVNLTAPESAVEGQTHTSSVTVTNHGPNAATSRTLIFSPSFLIPVTAPAGCIQDLASTDVLCDLTGMAGNTSRTFVFSGTASYQQWASSEVNVSLTESGNDLGTYQSGQYQYIYVERDPNTLHSLELAVSGVQAEYFVNDAVSASMTVTNHGPSVSPEREVSIYKSGLTLNVPPGCNDEGWRIACPIPSLAVGATWAQTMTGTASTQTPNGYLQIDLPGHELETYTHSTYVFQSFPVRGYVGTFSTAFTPVPPLSFDISTPQTFTVVVTNSGQFSGVPDTLKIQLDRPGSGSLGGISTTGFSGCDHIIANAYQQIEFCPVPVIAAGSSWSFSYTVGDSSAGRFRTQAITIGNNERTGNIAYHEVNTVNGSPLLLVWKPGNELPSSPPGFVYGSSYPFAVNITNPNTSSKSFSLEVSIPQGGYIFSLSAPTSCSVTTNPAIFNPGDYIDRIATCPMTLAAGQTSSVFFSANFPDCDYDPPQNGINCGTTVQNTDVKARLIGVVATPLTKRVKVNQ